MNVYFIEPNEARVFSSSKDARNVYKFLYWKEEDLLIACANNLTSSNTYHTHLKEVAQKLGIEVPEKTPDGAGNGERGKVTYWGSTGFGVETKEELRPLLAHVLGMEAGIN